MVSVAAKGNTSWVCDPSLVSYALEQPEMLRSPDYSCKRCAQFKFAPTVSITLYPGELFTYEPLISSLTKYCISVIATTSI